MTFPSSGAVSLNAFADAVGDSDNVHSMSEFYRQANGPVFDAPDNADIPSDTNQPIKFSQLYGTTAVAFRSSSEGVQDNNQSVNTLSKFFNSTDRTNKYCKLTVDTTIIATTNQGTIQTGDFAKGLYLEFTGNTNYIAGGDGTKGNDPLWNSNNNEAAANSANPGNAGGTGLTVNNNCAFVRFKNTNDYSVNAPAFNRKVFGGGGGPGSGGAYNRGGLGDKERRNNPNNGNRGYYNFGGIGSMSLNINTTFTNHSWNYNLSQVHNTGNAANNYVYSTDGNPGTYNQSPIGAAGTVGAKGAPGNAGSNNVTANGASLLNTRAIPNSGNNANTGQGYNYNPPTENLYDAGSGIGAHGSNNSWVYFPTGNPNSPLRNHAPLGWNINGNTSNGNGYTIAVSKHYGYPTFAIFRQLDFSFPDNPPYYLWFKTANVGTGGNNHPSGHLQLVPPGNNAAVGNIYQQASSGNPSNVLNPASAGGPPGSAYSDPNNRISTGDLDPNT